MSDETDKPFSVAKLIVGEPFGRQDIDIPTILYPLRHCRVITTNGEIWDRLFQCLQIDPKFVMNDYLTDRNGWTRYIP